MPPVRTVWRYFPDKKGTVTGIITTGSGVSASILILLSEAIINPNKVSADSDGYYNEDVAKRVNEFKLV